jgi:hypothetical protein
LADNCHGEKVYVSNSGVKLIFALEPPQTSSNIEMNAKMELIHFFFKILGTDSDLPGNCRLQLCPLLKILDSAYKSGV